MIIIIIIESTTKHRGVRGEHFRPAITAITDATAVTAISPLALADAVCARVSRHLQELVHLLGPGVHGDEDLHQAVECLLPPLLHMLPVEQALGRKVEANQRALGVLDHHRRIEVSKFIVPLSQHIGMFCEDL